MKPISHAKFVRAVGATIGILLTAAMISQPKSLSKELTVTPEMKQYLATVSHMAQDKWLLLRNKQDWKAVDKAWTQKRPQTPDSQVAVMTAFDEKGKPVNPKVSKSSGNTMLDGIAIDAVKAAAPYPVPPKQAANLPVQINFVAHLPSKNMPRMIPLK